MTACLDETEGKPTVEIPRSVLEELEGFVRRAIHRRPIEKVGGSMGREELSPFEGRFGCFRIKSRKGNLLEHLQHSRSTILTTCKQGVANTFTSVDKVDGKIDNRVFL